MVNVKTIGEVQLGLGIAIILFVLVGTFATLHNAKTQLENTIGSTKTDFEANLKTFLDRYEEINQKYNLTTEEESQKTMTLLFNSANMKYSYENFVTNMKYSYNNFVYLIFTSAVILIILAIILILEGLSDVRIEKEFQNVENVIEEEKSETLKI
jgi:hypothetical protein